MKEVAAKSRMVMQHLFGENHISDAFNSVENENDYSSLRDTFGFTYTRNGDTVTASHKYHMSGLKPIDPENMKTSICLSSVPEGTDVYRLLASMHVSRMETI